MRGSRWSEDVVLLGSSGASRYVSEQDRRRFADDFAWLLECLEDSDAGELAFSID
jgi:hypothetical protein